MNRFLPLLSFLVALALGWIFTSAPREELPKDVSLSSRTLRSGGANFAGDQRKRVGEIAGLKSYEEQVRQVIALASSIPVEDIAAWHRRDLIEGLDGDLETLFSKITSERWLAAKPREFVEWTLMMDDHQTYLYLAQWAIQDPVAANDFIQGLPFASRSYQVGDVIARMTQSRPDLAIKFLEENLAIVSRHGGHQLKRNVAALAEHDLDAVLAASKSWPRDAQLHASAVIAGVLLKKDFSEGMSFLKNEGLDWKTFDSSLDREIPETLIKNWEQLPEGWLSKLVKKSAYYFATAKNGLELLEADPEALGLDSSAVESLAAYARNIPMTGNKAKRLMAVINGETLPLPERRGLLYSKIDGWNRNDPEGLREWLRALDDPELHEIADRGLESFDRRSDPPLTVADEIARVMLGEELDYSLRKGITRWSPMETEVAVASYQILSVEEQQKTFAQLGQTATDNFGFFKGVFTEAANFPISDDANNQQRIEKRFERFSRNFAIIEPANAAEWVAGLPAGSRRQSAIKGVVNSWKQYSPSEAESWIKTLPAEDQVGTRAVLETR